MGEAWEAFLIFETGRLGIDVVQEPHLEAATAFRYDHAANLETLWLSESLVQTGVFPATLKATYAAFGSEDHRGTPEAPGRVVTLIERSFWETLDDHHRETEGDRVWGAAYHIVPSRVKEVQEYLDIREINGYSIQYTPFHPADPSMEDIRCMVYIGMPDNPQFLGALKPADIAKKINESRGPSGENREYLLQLEAALETLSPDSGDKHVSDLARRVRAMTPLERDKKTDEAAEHPLHRVGSTEEQEEIEKD